MEKLVPWAELCSVIEPHYPKAGNGRPPVGLERMLRMHFVQHWFNLADEACEEALLDSPVMSPIEQTYVLEYADQGRHEQFQAEFKSDLDLMRVPLGKFSTNDLVCDLAALLAEQDWSRIQERVTQPGEAACRFRQPQSASQAVSAGASPNEF